MSKVNILENRFFKSMVYIPIALITYFIISVGVLSILKFFISGIAENNLLGDYIMPFVLQLGGIYAYYRIGIKLMPRFTSRRIELMVGSLLFIVLFTVCCYFLYLSIFDGVIFTIILFVFAVLMNLMFIISFFSNKKLIDDF